MRCIRPQASKYLNPNASQSWLNFSLVHVSDSSGSSMTAGKRPPGMFMNVAFLWAAAQHSVTVAVGAHDDGGGHGGFGIGDRR